MFFIVIPTVDFFHRKHRRFPLITKAVSCAPPKTVSSVQPEEIKLMVKQEGPGQYQVRSRGVNKVVRRQVRNLLARVKGKLYVNGTLVASSKAFGMIIKLLMDKKVVHVKIVSQN